MYLSSISLQNFRNYKKASFSFSENTTLIVGPNTSGKTNLLEAISFLSLGQSLRAPNDEQAIRFGQTLGSVKARTDETDLQVMITSGRRKYLVNGVAKQRVNFAGNLTVVSFSPLDLDILIGSPSKRREFLDSILSQTDRDYRLSENVYQKGLRHRNRLLHKAKETGHRNEKEFEYWDDLLINSGQTIGKKREEFIDFLNSRKKDVYDFQIIYDKSVISKARLLQYKDAEVGAGVTLVGPHRDDFIMQINANDIKFFGSRGQQRLAVLQLKLLELIFIKNAIGKPPILLLDDIFSELDEGHINLVLNMIGAQRQTIVTTTHKEFIPKSILKTMSVIELKK